MHVHLKVVQFCLFPRVSYHRESLFSPYPDVVWYTHTLSHVGERGSGVLNNVSGHIGPGRSQTESMMFLNCNLAILVF